MNSSSLLGSISSVFWCNVEFLHIRWEVSFKRVNRQCKNQCLDLQSVIKPVTALHDVQATSKSFIAFRIEFIFKVYHTSILLHLSKNHEHLSTTLRVILFNVKKRLSVYLEKWKIDPGSRSGLGSVPKYNPFGPRVSSRSVHNFSDLVNRQTLKDTNQQERKHKSFSGGN